MKAIILAGGYATRLQPLTDDLSKCLLPVGGKPMVDWILERIREVEEIDEVHVVTNSRFAQDFQHWAMFKEGVTVHDDGTSSNEDRLGAIGDVAFTLERAEIDDDVLVIAGDNLFDYDLQDYVDFWRGKGVASAVAVHDVGDLQLASQYGIVDVAGDDRVVAFVEKPAEPASTLAATATYIYHRAHLPLVGRYLAEGNAPDQSGSFFAWLQEREPVYAYWFTGVWLDIGDKEQLLAADNMLRRAQGLPERDEYSLDGDRRRRLGADAGLGRASQPASRRRAESSDCNSLVAGDDGAGSDRSRHRGRRADAGSQSAGLRGGCDRGATGCGDRDVSAGGQPCQVGVPFGVGALPRLDEGHGPVAGRGDPASARRRPAQLRLPHVRNAGHRQRGGALPLHLRGPAPELRRERRHRHRAGSRSTSRSSKPMSTCPDIGRLTLHPRSFGDNRLFDSIDSALTSDRVVQLESAELEREYKLEVHDSAPDLAVRLLFEPAFMVWCLDQAADQMLIEIENGTLVVAIPDHSYDETQLDALVERAATIATRVADASSGSVPA